jgi:hypothetical protein
MSAATRDERTPDRGADGFSKAVDDAEALLHYAAREGLLTRKDALPQSPSPIITSLIAAREACRDGTPSTDVVVNFWVAYGQLAAAVKPVTATSLAACRKISLTTLKIGAGGLVLLVIVLSIFLFTSNTTLRETSDLIDQQNATAL